MDMRSAAGVAIFLFSTACGSGSSQVSFSGTVRGRSFAPAEAISAAVTIPIQTVAGVVNAGAGGVLISSKGGLCDLAAQNKEPKNTQYLLLGLIDFNLATGQSSAPTAAGSYIAWSGAGQPSSKTAIVSYQQTDPNCQQLPAAAALATSGTVNLTSVDGNAYSGSFDLNLDSGDHVTGAFRASGCAALGTLISPSRTTTCI